MRNVLNMAMRLSGCVWKKFVRHTRRYSMEQGGYSIPNFFIERRTNGKGFLTQRRRGRRGGNGNVMEVVVLKQKRMKA
jgi:hypothetical protein